ncbi:hypothetical protein [Thalassotalea mangrovi]|uniref:Uncharacterized protein n=1 Tax=Thalassotalea mangrovi TaxID=2572245 RepID=A0A4U1B2P8_9GAMM|nr:hypothetical protein [Thalassotalea mangrovi]TKB43978.1 hypothetical protein E8M12_13465 [Thalassotalea mangrovi]
MVTKIKVAIGVVVSLHILFPFMGYVAWGHGLDGVKTTAMGNCEAYEYLINEYDDYDKAHSTLIDAARDLERYGYRIHTLSKDKTIKLFANHLSRSEAYTKILFRMYSKFDDFIKSPCADTILDEKFRRELVEMHAEKGWSLGAVPYIGDYNRFVIRNIKNPILELFE